MSPTTSGYARETQTLCFESPDGLVQVHATAVVLAVGGGSWPRLGSDGSWIPLLAERGVTTSPLLPANCGFDVHGGWSEHFRTNFAGHPFKSVAIEFTSSDGEFFNRKGEFVATETGLEGSLIYAASSVLREEIRRTGRATFYIDLLPEVTRERVLAEVSHPRGARTLSSHLKSRLHIYGIKMALVHEVLTRAAINEPEQLATALKTLPITLDAARPLEEAISSAGGVLFEELTPSLMLNSLPGVFCAGEMIDWEAPTGGYLLTACLSSGREAGLAAAAYVRDNSGRRASDSVEQT